MSDKKNEWWAFDSIKESFDEEERVYVLKYTFPLKKELEEWAEVKLNDENYEYICQSIVSYFWDGDFIRDCFIIPEELDPDLLKKVGLENWDRDDLFDGEGYRKFIDKLGGDWEVDHSEKNMTLTWQVPEWFEGGQDDYFCDSQLLFIFITDSIQESISNNTLDLGDVMDMCKLSEVYNMLNKGQKDLLYEAIDRVFITRDFNAGDQYEVLNLIISGGLFEDKFMKGKNYEKIINYFIDLPGKPKNPIRVHHIYESIIKYFYCKRDNEGYFDRAIKFCHESIEFSNKYMKKDDKYRFEHHGYKQLSIIYNKQQNYEKAINLCQEALNEGWKGDWSDRVSKNKKTWANKTKSLAIQLEKEKKYQEVIELCQAVLDKGLDGDWSRRIERCKPLIGIIFKNE